MRRLSNYSDLVLPPSSLPAKSAKVEGNVLQRMITFRTLNTYSYEEVQNLNYEVLEQVWKQLSEAKCL